MLTFSYVELAVQLGAGFEYIEKSIQYALRFRCLANPIDV